MIFLFLFLSVVHAEIIYEKISSGLCESPYMPVYDKNTCDIQSATVGWNDNTAKEVSFSSYLPSGCTYSTTTDDLRIYSRSSTKECSNMYICLCSLTASLCNIGTNENVCICGQTSCRHDNGLVCSSSGQCSHPPDCSLGSNANVCECGSRDCTPTTGLVCSISGQCSHASTCSNTDGSIINSDICKCGSKDCSKPYCYASQNKCVDACPAGTYRNSQLTCSDCLINGYYCPSGSTPSATSFSCPAGKWSDKVKISSPDQCSSCPVGKWSSQTGLPSISLCKDCSSGRYSSETGLASNDECKGRCSSGRYSSKTGLTSNDECKGRCSAGRYSSNEGLTSNDQCYGCSAGKWSTQLGLTSDESCSGKCSVGKYSTNIGLVSDNQCQVCGVNKYQDEIGQTFCKGCPSDKLISDTVTASKHDNVEDCVEAVPVCLATQHLENNICVECKPSFFCDGISIIECTPGSYCSGDGVVRACPTGRYGEKKSQINMDNACQECSEGTYQNVVGQTYCSRGCPRGKFGQVVGASSEEDACQDCLVGHQCPTTSMNRPEKCPLGSYQSQEGSEVCILCAKNNYSDVLGSFQCKICGKNVEGQVLQTRSLGANSYSQCILQTKTCALNERLLETNECQKCYSGSYGTETGCRLCPKGYYQPNEGSIECLECESKRCQNMMGCSEESQVLPKTWSSSLNRTIDMPVENRYYVFMGSIIAYICLGVIIITLILTHRLWPSCLKHLDVFFAGEHIIQHKHARRVVRTRLGASLSLSLPLFVAGLAVFVFTSENSLSSEGLVPVISQSESSYGNFRIQYLTESGSPVETCSNIVFESKLNCSHQWIQTKYTCMIDIRCEATVPFSGTQYIEMAIPNMFQRAVCSVSLDPWNYSTTNITQVIYPNKVLAGTWVNPSSIEFDITRSLLQNNVEQIYDNGLQITPRFMHLIEDDESLFEHVITFVFHISDNMFVRKTDAKLELITQIGTILTLMISVVSVLKNFKIGLESCIDNFFLKCVKKPPKDVLKRKTVLEEKNSVASIEMTNSVASLQICLDEQTGKRYIHDSKSGTSIWLEENSINRTTII